MNFQNDPAQMKVSEDLEKLKAYVLEEYGDLCSFSFQHESLVLISCKGKEAGRIGKVQVL